MTRPDRELIQQLGIIPKLRLGMRVTNENGKKVVVGNGPHRVKLIAVKLLEDIDPRDGKKKEYVRYLFEEGGQKKKYQTKRLNDKGELSYLVQRLAEIDDNEEIILEMKKAGIKNYVEVMPVGHTDQVEVEEDHETEE